MFVAHLLYAYRKRKNISLDTLHIVHCNHQTRPENDQEEQLVREVFSELPVHVYTYTGKKKKESDLRQRRYSCLRMCAETVDASVIVTGHHLDDRIETSLLHMLRGCGLDGFLGMRMRHIHPLLPEKYIYRPLL